MDNSVDFIRPANVGKTVQEKTSFSVNGNVDGEDIVEQAIPLDRYENADRFGSDRISYTLRIRYRSNQRTLTNQEINEVQAKVRSRVAVELGAKLR